ncbi:MAG: LD-carboxypeptidase [Thermodesulfobacteriota bacterium]
MSGEKHPPSLRRGDCIGIVAPAGQISDTDGLEQGISILKEMGFEVKLPRNLWPGSGYLADSDTNRALEFHRMWADPEISALIALRGGFGCLRLAGLLEEEEIQRDRKLFVGFSDITILHGFLHQAADMVSLHGPVLTSLHSSSKESLLRFHASLSGKWDAPIKAHGVEVLRGGDPVRGRLLGGNLSSLLSTLGTPFELDLSGSILFLEDVGEQLYRIDRMLTQLAHAGKLAQPAAIVLGDFSMSAEMEPLEKIRFHEEIWKRMLELTASSGVVIWGNFPVGHGSDNLTLPHGAETLMDSGKVQLLFS